MKRLLLLAFPLLLAARPGSGAQAPSPTTTTARAETSVTNDKKVELVRYHWQLQDATNRKGRRIDALFVRPDKPLQLDFSGDWYSMDNSCNSISGRYVLSGEFMTVFDGVQTLVGCMNSDEIGKRFAGTMRFALMPADAPTLTITNTVGDELFFVGKRLFMEVAAHAKLCSRPPMPGKQCLQVREVEYDHKGARVGTPAGFKDFYGSIDGYTHEDGVRSVLRVERFAIKNPPLDSSVYGYMLDKVVELDATGK
jgi:hypothetical protein